jgi:hypothetical protein
LAAFHLRAQRFAWTEDVFLTQVFAQFTGAHAIGQGTAGLIFFW